MLLPFCSRLIPHLGFLLGGKSHVVAVPIRGFLLGEACREIGACSQPWWVTIAFHAYFLTPSAVFAAVGWIAERDRVVSTGACVVLLVSSVSTQGLSDRPCNPHALHQTTRRLRRNWSNSTASNRMPPRIRY